MASYVLRRLLLMIPVALLVTVIVFTLMRLSPGDPVLVYAGEERDPESLAQIRRSLGLDRPLPFQYAAWLTRALQGDLGRSIRTRQSVLEAIAERLPATFMLGGAAVLLSVSVALVVGTLAAVKRNSALDLLATGFTLAGVSLPNFFLGLILILLFALVLRLFPPGGYVRFDQDPTGSLTRLVLPAITLASASMAVNVRQMRSSLLDVLSQDYIRTARAKGLRERAVIGKHALKNALIPVVTLIGLQIGAIIEGAVITETIFFWPGIGKLLVDSIAGRDYPVVQAVVMVSALSFMLTTLLVDLLYAYLDPRISYGAHR
ncbi:MAG TPA: ABC transporter permease [Chloroflexota bacterium]|jgi:peptide/nickel transport system permease protein|nr:ABC transporter permease [Chloroflexota bacterium]